MTALFIGLGALVFVLGAIFGAALYGHARQCIEDLKAERPGWWDL
ncbi:MAG TPA: hypothetical protein VGN96_11260 [Roseococcus sp.]|jgi:hypothetical protein|nr:hypothetical protein [Roseococcus sp.]